MINIEEEEDDNKEEKINIIQLKDDADKTYRAPRELRSYFGILESLLTLLLPPCYPLQFFRSLGQTASTLFALNQSEKYSNLSKISKGCCVENQHTHYNALSCSRSAGSMV